MWLQYSCSIFFIQPPRTGTPGWLFINLAKIGLGTPPLLSGLEVGGGSPAVTKKRGKGPPFTHFFHAAYAVGGTLQIVKKGRGAPPNHLRGPHLSFFGGLGGILGSTPPLVLWASWGWRALFSFLEKGGGARPVVSQSCVYLVRFDLLRRPSYCSLGQFDLLPS